MAGTIPLSMTQQFDIYGKPLSGGQLYIIQAGTVSTPQNAFQDTALSILQPYPMTLDAAGRIPQFFLADGTVKVRLQDRAGVVQLTADSVLVIGPSAGGGGGGVTVDPTQLIQTGMMMFMHTVAQQPGFVRLNGRTVGSATSGATERNNPDTQALFLFLWPDAALPVSGGRGASAAADWAANKTIATPDWRGFGISALDDMGNAAAGRLSAPYFPGATSLGQTGGGQSYQLGLSEIPIFRPSGSVANGVITATPTWNGIPGGGSLRIGNGDTAVVVQGGVAVCGLPGNLGINIAQGASIFTGDLIGGGGAHRTIGPRKLITFYMKL